MDNNQPLAQGASLDEGAIIFRRYTDDIWGDDGVDLVADGRVIFHKLDDGTWGVQGLDLAEGDTVTVTTKDGKEYDVVVGEIINDENGLQMATFSWPEHDN
ncbi:hypothetical protein ACTOVN_00170 [Arcanobacterium canis]